MTYCSTFDVASLRAFTILISTPRNVAVVEKLLSAIDAILRPDAVKWVTVT